MDSTRPARLIPDPRNGRLICSGDWTLSGIGDPATLLSADELATHPGPLDATDVTHLDTVGALLLVKLRDRLGGTTGIRGLTQGHDALVNLVDQYLHREMRVPEDRPGPLAALGMRVHDMATEVMDTLDFIGRFAADAAPRLLRPHRLRWKQIVGELQAAGVNAMPILGMLAFLTGVVIAYQGGTPLRQYGANIFIVDLLSITMLREMAPLMTAIILAGRTGSAYTAQIGTMRITQEVDALRTLGMSPLEILALPKFLALVIAMPLLTLFADVLGMLGGILVAFTLFDISLTAFLDRLPQVVAPSSFWIGIAKAPVFAAIIVTVSCHHGFSVQGSTESVGRATTRSVVQSIFLVILADAAFSVIFNLLDL